MEECPCCTETTYASHKDRGIKQCNTCEEKVCSTCFYGCRYTCPVAISKPINLERQVNNDKWESSEEYLKNNPNLKEVVVEYIPREHLFKIVRDEQGNLVRLHYDRVCTSCHSFFLHEDGLDKLFVCQECLNKK